MTSPFHNLIPDCLSVIFSFHIQLVLHDINDYSRSDVLFMRKFIFSWKFGTAKNINVKEFLLKTRGQKVKLQYVCARENSLLDNDTFKLFRGIRELNVAICETITDEALENLRGIEILDISNCQNITSGAFVNLRGVKDLNIAGMTHLSEFALVHLRGIERLDMNNCFQMTDAGIVNLRGIKSLDISYCAGLTDACFENLRGIEELTMNGCIQDTITANAFQNLRGIKALRMSRCGQIPGSVLRNLIGVHELRMTYTNSICDADLRYLVGVKILDLRECERIIGTGFHFVRGVQEVTLIGTSVDDKQDLAPLREARIVHSSLPCSDQVLRNMRHAKKMHLYDSCIASGDHVFANLANVEELFLVEANMEGITDEAFRYMRRLKRLTMYRCPGCLFTKRMMEYLSGQLEYFDCQGGTQMIELNLADVDDVVRCLAETQVLIVRQMGNVWDKVLAKWKEVRGWEDCSEEDWL